MDYNGPKTGLNLPASGIGMDGSSVFSVSRSGGTNEEKVKTLAKEFEAVLLGQMLKTMRSTIDDSGFIKKGPGEELFTEMLDEEFARQMAYSNSRGLASSLVEQLLATSAHGKTSEVEAGHISTDINKPEGKVSKAR